MNAPMRRGPVASTVAAPLILVVGAQEALLAACHEVGERLAVRVRACDLASIRAVVDEDQPYAILVTEDVYRFDPAALDAFARSSGASLVRIEPRDASARSARRLLVEAVFEAAAMSPGSGIRPAVR